MSDPRRDAYKAARRRGLSPAEALAEAEKVPAQPTIDPALMKSAAASSTAAVPDPERRQGVVGTIIREGVHGATFGLDDEAAGAVGGLVSGVTGQGFKKGYLETRDAVRAEQAKDAASRPVLSTASQFLGGLAVPAGVFGAATKGAGTMAKVATGAKIGAVSGALQGTGNQDSGPGEIATPGEVLRSGAVGGTVGGVVGAAVPAIVGGAKALSRFGERVGGGDMSNDAVQAVAQRFGVPEDQMGKLVLDATDDVAGDAAGRIGRSPEEHAAFMAVKKAPTVRTRVWPAPPPVQPPTPPTATFAQQVGEMLNSGPSASQTARNIAGATGAGRRTVATAADLVSTGREQAVGQLLDHPRPFRPTQGVVGGPAATPADLGQKGFASTLTGKGWAGGDAEHLATRDLWRSRSSEDNAADLVEQIRATLAKQSGGFSPNNPYAKLGGPAAERWERLNGAWQ